MFNFEVKYYFFPWMITAFVALGNLTSSARGNDKLSALDQQIAIYFLKNKFKQANIS